MKSVTKYIQRKSADGTVSAVTLATLVTFNLLYFISQYAINKEENFSFLKGIKDPMYIITSSILAAVLISSFIFHKIKTKSISCSDQKSFNEQIKEGENCSEKNKIKKMTLELKMNGIELPYLKDGHMIEIPVEDSDLLGYGKAKDQISEKVTFVHTLRNNKSVYSDILHFDTIRNSKVDFFNRNDFEKYTKDSSIAKYQNGTVTFKSNTNNKLLENGDLQEVMIKSTKSFQFSDLCYINSVKFHYEDGGSMKVKLKLAEEPAVDMDLLNHVNATISDKPNPSLKEPQVMFIPAIAGDRPIYGCTVH